ncbi:MAG TPA: LysR family transcriptional regulator, partial [Microthrixaceae bacterium]|nr:LysR family transcriptional regulator [Microthrixaceae bacterium]
MELDDLAAVLATAESGSITAAATRLHVAQPALSRRIARLERTLGGPLFVRGRHGAHPTAAGEVLVAGAGDVVASLRDL